MRLPSWTIHLRLFGCLLPELTRSSLMPPASMRPIPSLYSLNRSPMLAPRQVAWLHDLHWFW